MKRDEPQPCVRRGNRVGRAHRLPYRPQRIGQQRLRAQAGEKAAHPFLQRGGRYGAFFQFPAHILIQDDRPGDQLREKQNKRGVIDKIPLGGHFAAINVDDICLRLKGVKADAERQRSLRRIRAQPHRVHKKRSVFEKNKRAEIDQQACRQGQRAQARLFARRSEAKRPVEQHRPDDQRHIPDFSPRIKENACGKQKGVARLRGQQQVRKHRAGQEKDKKRQA